MKASIDRDGCIGCGLCTETCPEVFRMADDGLAETYGEINADNKEEAIAAADNCPVSVIILD